MLRVEQGLPYEVLGDARGKDDPVRVFANDIHIPATRAIAASDILRHKDLTIEQRFARIAISEDRSQTFAFAAFPTPESVESDKNWSELQETLSIAPEEYWRVKQTHQQAWPQFAIWSATRNLQRDLTEYGLSEEARLRERITVIGHASSEMSDVMEILSHEDKEQRGYYKDFLVATATVYAIDKAVRPNSLERLRSPMSATLAAHLEAARKFLPAWVANKSDDSE